MLSFSSQKFFLFEYYKFTLCISILTQNLQSIYTSYHNQTNWVVFQLIHSYHAWNLMQEFWCCYINLNSVVWGWSYKSTLTSTVKTPIFPTWVKATQIIKNKIVLPTLYINSCLMFIFSFIVFSFTLIKSFIFILNIEDLKNCTRHAYLSRGWQGFKVLTPSEFRNRTWKGTVKYKSACSRTGG